MALREITETEKQPAAWRLSLRWLMVFGFGGLVAASIAVVLFMSVSANFANTFSLLNDRAHTLVSSMERSIRVETSSAERVVAALARVYNDDGFEIGDFDSQRQVLKSLLIASPIVEVLMIYDPEGVRTGIARTPDGNFFDLPIGASDAVEAKTLRETAARVTTKGPFWGEPVFINDILFHNVGLPLTKDDEIVGYAVAAIGRNSMNRIVSDLGDENDTTAFIMDTSGSLVAHSRLGSEFKGKQNIPVDEFPDQALRQLKNAKLLDRFEGDDGAAIDNKLNVYEYGEGMMQPGFIYITRELEGYSHQPYTLGAYFKKEDIGSEIQRAILSAFAGVAALALAVLIAFFISRRISKPLDRMAAVASDFSNLKLDGFEELPRSRIAEIDAQSRAFNSLHTALSEFSSYVPRKLVLRLLQSGKEATRSVEREVTVMFSDIVGFTSISENLNAAQTAELLNFHFDLVCSRITANNGTVDKFMGDGVMSFWGAPDADDDQAANALKASQEIIEKINAENEKRIANGLVPIRLRIGIHTGRAVVGNIGSCDRQNYTIVGDAVNIANRLEQLGKEVLGKDSSIILVSENSKTKGGEGMHFEAIGNHQLRGRKAGTSVYRVVTSEAKSAAIGSEAHTGARKEAS